MIEFGFPLAFLLLPLPLVIHYVLPAAKRETSALMVPFFNRLKKASSEKSNISVKNYLRIRWLILGVIWLAFVLSAAQPSKSGEAIAMPTEGRDLMLAFDISGSMSTSDMVIQDENISRVVIVKHILSDFLQKRVGDRVGLILFGTNAYLQAPLTFDLTTVSQFLDETTLRLAGERTAIGDAIGLAVKRLKDRPASQRVVILLTDGANTAGTIKPRKAADLAARAGVKVYTVGVGADSMQVSRGFFGTQTINPSSDLDEDTLRYIADTTGGQYFRGRDPQELSAIYDHLDKMEKIEQDKAFYRPLKSLYHLPLAAALLMSMLYYWYFFLRQSQSLD